MASATGSSVSSTGRPGGQPKPPVIIPGAGNNIVVNPCQVRAICPPFAPAHAVQRGNPVLECVRNVGKEFGEILADYQVGRTTGVLFLRCVDPFQIVALSLYSFGVLAVCGIIGYIQNISINALRSLGMPIIFAFSC